MSWLPRTEALLVPERTRSREGSSPPEQIIIGDKKNAAIHKTARNYLALAIIFSVDRYESPVQKLPYRVAKNSHRIPEYFGRATVRDAWT